MDRDAAFGVAGDRQDLGTAAEVEHIAVAELPIHRHRRCRVRQADRNTLMDRHFPVLERRRRQCRTRPDRRRVTGARIDRRAGRLVQFGGRAAVIDVTVGQHDPVDARHSRKDSAPDPGAPVSISVTESSSRQIYSCQPLTRNMVRFGVIGTVSMPRR